jgi:hypothetical protein
MSTVRRLVRARLLSVLALVALLGVPLALAGHHHAGTDVARDCSVCVVAHCSPAEVASPATLPAVLVSRPLPRIPAPRALPALDRPAHPGRAPPTFSGDTAV